MITYDEVVLARRGTPCGSIGDQERRAILTDILARTYGLLNYEPGLTEIDDTVAELDAKISSAYRHLTPEEIRLALEAGSVGDYGQTNRKPIPANILSWVSTFATGELRRAVIRDEVIGYTPVREEPLSFIEREQRNEAAGRNGALRLFNEVLTTGTFEVALTGYAAMVYDYLKGLGRIHPSEETVRAAYNEAKAHRARPVDFDAALASTVDLLDWQTKEILLRKYFQNLVNHNVTQLSI